MDLKFLFVGTVLFINQITSSPVISNYNKDREDSPIEDIEDHGIGSYQVTENVIDVPDDRTLAPILANFSIISGLNYANPTVKQNKTNIDKEDNWNKEESNPNNEAVNIANKPIRDKENNLKKNQFSILHIKAEYDNPKVENTNDRCQYVFSCLKEYFDGVKKGFVDGIHSFLRKKEKQHSILDKFHRNVDFEDSHEIHGFSDEFGDD